MTNRDRPELFIRVVMAWIAIVFIGIGAMVYRHKPEYVKLSDDKVDIPECQPRDVGQLVYDSSTPSKINMSWDFMPDTIIVNAIDSSKL